MVNDNDNRDFVDREEVRKGDEGNSESGDVKKWLCPKCFKETGMSRRPKIEGRSTTVCKRSISHGQGWNRHINGCNKGKKFGGKRLVHMFGAVKTLQGDKQK